MLANLDEDLLSLVPKQFVAIQNAPPSWDGQLLGQDAGPQGRAPGRLNSTEGVGRRSNWCDPEMHPLSWDRPFWSNATTETMPAHVAVARRVGCSAVPRAFALRRSNSACVIEPLSSRPLALSICSVGSVLAATN